MSKIIFYTENYARGGGNRYLLDCVNLISDNFTEFSIYTNKGGVHPDELNFEISSKNKLIEVTIGSWGELRINQAWTNLFPLKVLARLFYLSICPLVWLYQIVRFFILLRKERPSQIWIAQGGYPAGGSGLRFALVGRILSIKTIMSIVATPSTHKVDLLRLCFWNPIIRKIVDAIIVNSFEIKNKLLEKEFSDTQIHVVTNFLIGQGTKKYKLNNPLRVLYFARLDPIKDFNTLVLAYEELPNEYKNKIHLDIYGQGSQSDLAASLSRKYPALVTYHGFVQDGHSDIFNKSDVYILPSLLEGLPYTVLEAAKAGCCILTTGVGGMKDILINRRNALFFEPKNYSQLSKLLIQVIDDKNLISNLGINAQESFNKAFEHSILSERIKLLLMKIKER